MMCLLCMQHSHVLQSYIRIKIARISAHPMSPVKRIFFSIKTIIYLNAWTTIIKSIIFFRTNPNSNSLLFYFLKTKIVDAADLFPTHSDLLDPNQPLSAILCLQGNHYIHSWYEIFSQYSDYHKIIKTSL